MRFTTEYIKKKLNELLAELEKTDSEDGWEWENLLALISKAKEQVKQREKK